MEVARLKKDSSTSSKPPSSDIVKPPKPGCVDGRRKRRRGGNGGTCGIRGRRSARTGGPHLDLRVREASLEPDWSP